MIDIFWDIYVKVYLVKVSFLVIAAGQFDLRTSREVLKREIILVVPGVGWPVFSPVTEPQLLVVASLLPGELLVSEGLLVGGAVVDLVVLRLLQLLSSLATLSLNLAGLSTLTG